MTRTYDMIVIGTGQADPFQAQRLASAGTGSFILRAGGDDAVHSILDAMCAKAPYTIIQRAMHIRRTISELIPTVLG